jgi:uncharacterized protein
MLSIDEVLKRKEDLHPDLKRYIMKAGPLGPMLKHPLVFDISYSEQLHAMYNEQLKVKQEYIDQRIKDGNFSGAIWLYERPYRFDIFMQHMCHLSDADYWSTLADLWTDTENMWQYKKIIHYLLLGRPASNGPRQMMNKDEKAFFKNLPNEVVVYRGYQTRNRQGYAWSLSPAKARWFARRFNHPKWNVVRGVIKKEDITAVFLRRGEYEVVTFPRSVKKQVIVTSLQRPDWLENILNETKKQFVLPLRTTHHGPEHWERVESNTITICRINNADEEVCRLFAVCHDCKRENENEDPGHGHRAADWIKKNMNLIPLDGDRLEKLLYACRFHNDGKVSEDPTIGTCWDADRLDLPMVGITPDPKFFSTKTAKQLIWRV